MEIMYIQFLLLLVASIQVVVRGAQGKFFLYGPLRGDHNLTNGNDETEPVHLPDGVSFPYYGENYTTIHVQTNGVLSFNQSLPESPKVQLVNHFPLNPRWNGRKQVNTLIAPFWADVDTTNQRGSVYYRQSKSGDDLKNATTIVRNHFPRYPTFNATWALIVTWRNVSFFEHVNSTTDPRNTFQAVLITDGDSSFVFLFYDEIKWTAGTLLGGDAVTGKTDILESRAIVGFNKGHGNTSFTAGFPDSRLMLPLNTNIRQVGSYAYQVNQDVIEAGCSDEGSTITTYPSSGSIRGGERIYLYGPCWNESGSLICQFWNTGNTTSLLQNITGVIANTNSAYCVPSNFSDDGEVDIKVSDDGGETFAYSGNYQIYPLTTTAAVTTSSPEADDGMEGWLIAIIVVASVLAVVLIGIIVFNIINRRKMMTGARKLPQEDEDVGEKTDLNEYS